MIRTITKNTEDKDKEISEEKGEDEENVELEQTFKCEVCEHTCENAVLLQKHIKTKHQEMKHEKLQEKKLLCHDCNKSFKSKMSLLKTWENTQYFQQTVQVWNLWRKSGKQKGPWSTHLWKSL